MISMPRKDKNITTDNAKPCAILVARSKHDITREEIVALIGDTTVSSQAQVAAAFGLRSTSIKTWKANGMPGSEGTYPLADIVLWRIGYEFENEKHTRPTGDHTNRLRELDIEKKELENKSLRDQYLAKQGQMIPLQQAQAEFYALVAMAKEGLLRVPAALAPMLPPKLKTPVTRECEKLIRHQLIALANGKGGSVNPAKLVPRVQELLEAHGMNGKATR